MGSFVARAAGSETVWRQCPREYYPAAAQDLIAAAKIDDFDGMDANLVVQNEIDISNLQPGQVGGIVTDPTGAVRAQNVTVVNKQTGATLSTRSDSDGRWVLTDTAWTNNRQRRVAGV